LNDFRFGIIFCSTKIMVDDLDEHMHSRGYAVDRLHGDITQAQRNRVMEKFRERKFEFLIATDVAARGLDVDDLEVVFNFDLPNDAEDYTHRIGRTGRAGRKGKAFTFVSGQEIYKLQSMVRWAKLDIRRGKIPSLDEVEEARTNVFFEKIRTTLEAKQFKPHDRMIDRLLDQGFASTDICSALIHLLQGTGGATPPVKAAKPAGDRPGWVPAEAAGASVEKASPPVSVPRATAAAPAPVAVAAKPKYERPARTGREPGMTTVFLNIGRKQLITPADIVGKIAGVTRLPAEVVGAIDIHQRHSLVDVADKAANVVVQKLAGIRVKGIALEPAIAGDQPTEPEKE
jgi:ATP-dependent RNA helicase DeaD